MNARTRINIETAKLLKNTNFNIGVTGAYTEYLVDNIDPEYPNGGGPFSMTKGEIELDTDQYIEHGNMASGDFTCKSYNQYAAPFQDTILKWFRDIHKTVISIKPSVYKNQLYYVSYVYNIINGEMVVHEIYGVHETYEDAIELAIQHTLKKIINEK